MNQIRRWQRILILSLLLLSVLAPIVFVSNRLKSITSVDRGEFIEELSDIIYKTDDLRLTATEQDGEALKEPKRILQDRDFNSVVWSSSSDKSNDTMQSNEGNKTTFLSEIDGGNIHKPKEEQAVVSQKTTVSSDAESNHVSQSGLSDVSKGGIRCQLLDWCSKDDIVVGEGEYCSCEPTYKIGRIPIGRNAFY